MAEDVPKAEPRPAPWSDKELAFLLNHADYCLKNDQDYMGTILDALSSFTSAQRRSASAVNNKLRWYLSKDQKNISPPVFRQQGTACLHLNSLSPAVLHEMASQRETLGLEALALTDPLPTAAGGDATNPPLDGPESTDNDNWKRNSACNADGGRKTYCEDTADDSDSLDGATSMGSEFTGETPKKLVRGKAHLIIRPPNDLESVKQTLAKKDSRPAPPSQSGHIPPNTAQTDTTIPPVTKGASTRKAIDVDSDEEDTAQNGSDKDSPPPRKRQRSCENERSAEVNEIMSSPTISEHSNVSEQVGVCPETPQPRSSSKVPFEKKRVTPSRLPSSVSKKPAYRPTVEKSSTQQSGGTIQQFQDSKQQQEDLRQQVEVLRQQQEETNNVLFHLYREWDPTGRKKLPEMSQRLILIARTMQKEPGSLAERVLEDVASLSYSNEKFRKTLKSLIGNQDDRCFPVHPPKRDVDEGWRRLQSDFRDAVTLDHPHDSRLPKAWVAGYLASQASHLFKDKNAALDPASYIEELEVPLDNLHTVLNIISALLCSWMFATPDAFCNELYSHKELQMYKMTLVTDGPSAVQKIDKMGAALMFSDETDALQNNRFAKQVSSLEHNLLTALGINRPDAPGLDPKYRPDEWLKDALKFKHSLLLSPKDYRVHFCLPGTPFDASWMAPEDVFGITLQPRETAGKRVVMCLFPALVEIEQAPFGEHVEVEEVLISNKRFFPTPAERRAFDPKTVVSKACVLLG